MCAFLAPFSLLTLLFISIPLALCLVIITPSSANGWRNSGPQLLEWQYAGSDPATFAVVLTTVDGTVSQLLATSVTSNRWSTDVNPPSGGWPVGTSFNFRIYFVQDANDLNTTYVISQPFNIEAVVPVNTTTSLTPMPSSTPISTLPTPMPSLTSDTTSTTSSSCASSTSLSLRTRPDSSPITSPIRSTSPADHSTTLVTSHYPTASSQYSTSQIHGSGTSTALRAGSSATATVSRTVLWGMLGILGLYFG